MTTIISYLMVMALGYMYAQIYSNHRAMAGMGTFESFDVRKLQKQLFGGVAIYTIPLDEMDDDE